MPPAGDTAPALLLVEDERDLSDMLVEVLTEEGYRVDRAGDGQSGLHFGLTRRYDVIVLDRGLPAVDGLDVLRKLRARGVTTAALLLTARGAVTDRVEGLDAGAEDYLVKPFDLTELLARLRALRRRHQQHADRVAVGDRWLDLDARQVRDRTGRAVTLSERECALLRTLATRPRQVFSRDDLRSLVFDAAESPGVVDTYVHYLRRKLGRDVVRTVHGLGYQIGAA
ncbi:response regulator transcription factor [Dactylosporangium cerinum]|uniref:Response regulator transcription factor n=1 Tax=Dactylosporangium cerinum TaxID=1434730 RepID=A0ABV9WHY0_9ACTN